MAGPLAVGRRGRAGACGAAAARAAARASAPTCAQVEDPLDLGLVDRVGQPPLGEDVGEVDERAGGAGDGDAVDDGAVLVGERARAMDDDARAAAHRAVAR